jgi:glutathione synthase/RimK-type ligase-like ATP-grasp enzyme
LPKADWLNIFWGKRGNFDGHFINNPNAISIARNKTETFKALDGKVPIPAYTTDKEVANGWINEGKVVLARTNTGQGGSGILICRDALDDAPLYSLYIKKKKEFRVHVAFDKVLLVQEKRRKRGIDSDRLIRSHRRGWVFCRNDIEEPNGLRDIAIGAVSTLGLDFGGVDVIWNQNQNQCYVLEVNTAPGLSDSTSILYANSILGAINMDQSNASEPDSPG